MIQKQLINLVAAAVEARTPYIFIDKTPENLQLVNDMRKQAAGQLFNFLIGQGEASRIKISWDERTVMTFITSVQYIKQQINK